MRTGDGVEPTTPSAGGSDRTGSTNGADSLTPAPTRAEPARVTYVPAFDGLRGILAVIVVTYHLIVLLPDLSPNLVEIAFYPPGGFLALDVFFAMSGFLITALLLREQGTTGRVSLLGFYRRRALRLLPALFALLIVWVIYSYATGIGDTLSWDWLAPIIFYYANFARAWGQELGPDGVGVFNHFWSLAVEEQFYVVWPLVVILVLGFRRRLTFVVPILVTLIAAIAVHRAILWNGLPDNDPFAWLDLYVRTDTRADAILVGCLLAYFWSHGIVPRRGNGLLGWIGAAILVVSMLLFQTPADAYYYLGGFTLCAVGSSLLLLALLESKGWSHNPVLRWKPLVVLGDVSYGVYLWHLPVFYVVQRYGMTAPFGEATADWPAAVRVAVGLGVTAVFVWLSYVLIERPFLRWKDRLERGRASKTVGLAERVDVATDPSTPATVPAA